jgi:uncharacterized membrane protein YraQ (UPF0718 family)
MEPILSKRNGPAILIGVMIGIVIQYLIAKYYIAKDYVKKNDE